MDTAQVAAELGTTPRVLRQFLRSPLSTFQAVGSGARYEFEDKNLPTLKKRFAEWKTQGKPRIENTNKPKSTSRKIKTKAEVQRAKDEAQWAEEGLIELEDIRNPRVRARVRRDAQRAEDRLIMLLLAKGRHITQLGNRESS